MPTVHSPTNIFRFPLPDAGLRAPRPEESAALVFQMAADLLETDTFRDHRVAFETLVLRGHHSYLVGCLIDDARQLAFQAVVEVAMRDS